MKIKGQDILALGFEEGKAVGIILKTLARQGKETLDADLKAQLEEIRVAPEKYQENPQWGDLAQELLQPKKDEEIPLNPEALDFAVYGREGIEKGAFEQMKIAAKLPIAKGGALMPDAHQGYGLPIGGVLASKNAIIPYGVGMDIGCRMCLSVFPSPPDFSESQRSSFQKMLLDHTRFGKATFKKKRSHAVLENPLFQEIRLLKEQKDRAFSQLGSSGGGNHFVEFGVVEILEEENEWQVAPGAYLALLSHSGSRGFGAKIAQHYTRLARDLCKLPKEAQHLAWLDLNHEAGQEYWLAMNLAGDYASACHHQIHDRIREALGEEIMIRVENHHNFAWKEKNSQGEEIIVHRKGATPAGKGVLGLIPGSMTAPGFIVRGKGSWKALNSASHGAGRSMSRTKAHQSLDKALVQEHLAKAGVQVIGSGLDEAPMAYKDIHQVMAAQEDLVEVLGTFMPKVVRMCGEEGYFEQD